MRVIKWPKKIFALKSEINFTKIHCTNRVHLCDQSLMRCRMLMQANLTSDPRPDVVENSPITMSSSLKMIKIIPSYSNNNQYFCSVKSNNCLFINYLFLVLVFNQMTFDSCLELSILRDRCSSPEVLLSTYTWTFLCIH